MTLETNGFLWRSYVAGILAALAVAVPLEIALHAQGALVILGVGQVIVQLSTAVFVILERRSGLLRAFAPGVILGLAYLAGLDARIAAVGVALSLVLSVHAVRQITAKVPTRKRRRAAGPVWRRGADFAATGVSHALESAPYLAYGLLGASFVCVTALGLLLHAPERASALALVVLPLVLASGLQETELRRFRERSLEALQHAVSMAGFGRAVQWVFWRGLARYVAALAALSGAVALLGQAHLIPAQSGTMLLAYLAIGPAFYASSLLVAQGQVRQVLACLTVALAVHALSFALTYRAQAADLETSFAVSSLLFAVLALGAVRSSISEIRHYR